MCSRFETAIPPERLATRYGLTAPPLRVPGPVIRPTDAALTIGPDGLAVERRFGLPAEWDKRPVLNARGETLEIKPFFRRLLVNRCIVPASAWFEWRTDGPRKHLNRLRRPDDEPLSLAALFDGANFVIVTCVPAAGIAHVHDRMPVVLTPAAERRWLSGDPSPDLRQPFPGITAEEQRDETPAPRQGDLFAD